MLGGRPRTGVPEPRGKCGGVSRAPVRTLHDSTLAPKPTSARVPATFHHWLDMAMYWSFQLPELVSVHITRTRTNQALALGSWLQEQELRSKYMLTFMILPERVHGDVCK